jgi:hypothetical protein
MRITLFGALTVAPDRFAHRTGHCTRRGRRPSSAPRRDPGGKLSPRARARVIDASGSVFIIIFLALTVLYDALDPSFANITIKGGEMAPSITDVRSIGKSTAATLAQHGIETVEQLADANLERVAAIPGFGAARAANVVEAAKALLSGGAAPAAPTKPARARAKAAPARNAKPAAPEATPVKAAAAAKAPKAKAAPAARSRAKAAVPAPEVTPAAPPTDKAAQKRAKADKAAQEKLKKETKKAAKQEKKVKKKEKKSK